MMKRIITFVAFLGMMISVASAQDEFKGHWYLQGQAGVAYTVGETGFSDLLTPAFAGSLGYQFCPIFGVRGTINGFRAKGSVPAPSETYRFKHITGTLELTADLCNIFTNYKSNRLFNPYVFAGLGGASVGGYGKFVESEKIDRLPKDSYYADGKAKRHVEFAGRCGAGVNVRLCNWLDFNIEYGCGFYPDRFNLKKGSSADFQMAGTAGFKISFCKGKKAAPIVAPVAPIAEEEPVKETLVVVEENIEESAPVVKEAPEFVEVTENAFFGMNKWVIRPAEQKKIDEVVATLKANPNTKVYVTGHADKETGYPVYNQKLSEKRANTVTEALISAGIAKNRIITKAVGDKQNPYGTPEENRVTVCVIK